MPTRTSLRRLTEEEYEDLKRISRSRTTPMRRVERAKIILGLAEGKRAEDIAVQMGVSLATVNNRRRRFNEVGLNALEDQPRSGRPYTYDEKQRSQMVLTAKTHPGEVGLELGHWTLDTLVAYVNDELAIPISRSQLADILKQEGLKWYQEKTYFTESPDPQFVEKRGRL